jgi:hypothetical protein
MLDAQSLTTLPSATATDTELVGGYHKLTSGLYMWPVPSLILQTESDIPSIGRNGCTMVGFQLADQILQTYPLLLECVFSEESRNADMVMVCATIMAK